MEATGPLARRLEGRVALITGAASAIGAATALRLADEGAGLVLTDVRQQAGEALAAWIRDRRGGALLLPQEVDDEAGWVIAVATALSEFGRLDVLVNSAGLVSPHRTGMLTGMRVAADALKSSGHGSVIDIRYPIGYPFGPFGELEVPPLWNPAKARPWVPEGVRVNCVHPGFLDTPMLAPMKRPGARPPRRLLELAACVAFLASDDASFITGLELYVEG
ncbi:MAG TPA: SDR family oxidoreductase [Candidatus Limnocylindrales bacterium]|nr:SDR family oxidoreductase [Candidatus Limnocylindrales bacterium]